MHGGAGVEAADVLLVSATTSNERITCGLARGQAVEALREMVRDLEPEITVPIMVPATIDNKWQHLGPLLV